MLPLQAPRRKKYQERGKNYGGSSRCDVRGKIWLQRWTSGWCECPFGGILLEGGTNEVLTRAAVIFPNGKITLRIQEQDGTVPVNLEVNC